MKRLAIVAAVVTGLALSSLALAAATLSGTYRTKVHSTFLHGALNGTWTIKFKTGSYTVAGPGNTSVAGKYSIQGNQITFKDQKSPNACGAPGTYRFTLAGKTLKFTRVSDSNRACAGRRTVLGGTFTKGG